MSFSFPAANQAQIIRANQRDLFHVASLREQIETLLRTWFGTRWLLRWDKEIELCAKLAYFGLTTSFASQTLGEEYTDTWQQPPRPQAIRKFRLALALFSALPPFFINRLIPRLNGQYPNSPVVALLRHLPWALETISEINLACFYFYGTYYNLATRIFRIRYISSLPPNPNITPPSYSILGLMLAIRLVYRLVESLRSLSSAGVAVSSTNESNESHGRRLAHPTSTKEPTIDARAVTSILAQASAQERDPVRAEEDEHTILHLPSMSVKERAGRRCILCLEERTSTCATECGHLFCWSCIIGWGREKSECPLCRQSLDLTRLLPIYNL